MSVVHAPETAAVPLIAEAASLADAMAAVQSGALEHVIVGAPGRYGREEFLAIAAEYADVDIELLPDGTIELMPLLTLRSNESESEAFFELKLWHRSSRLGKVYGPTAGYTLPDGSIRSPDASWVSPERLAPLSDEELDTMSYLVPDFVIEVMSKTDRLRRAKVKMREAWMANGVRHAWLLDPRRERAFVYREGVTEPEEIEGFERELAAEVPEGFVLDLRLLTYTGL